jgi:hypothetical protein
MPRFSASWAKISRHGFFAHALLELGRCRLAAARSLLHQQFGTRLRYRLAVDDGDVLRLGSAGEHGGHGQRGKGLLEHERAFRGLVGAAELRPA